VCEKYLALAKDSTASGDIILAESYLQHAEHYQRIINDFDAQDDRTQEGGRSSNSRHRKSGNQPKGEGDLSLPSSILGGDSKASEESGAQTRTDELSTAE